MGKPQERFVSTRINSANGVLKKRNASDLQRYTQKYLLFYIYILTTLFYYTECIDPYMADIYLSGLAFSLWFLFTVGAGTHPFILNALNLRSGVDL